MRIAYGAAGIVDRYPAYGLEFQPADRSVTISAVTAMLKQGLRYEEQDSSCVLFTPQQPMRLVKLIDDLYRLSLAAFEASSMTYVLDEAVILGDIVAYNLGLRSLSAASKGPFKICGRTYSELVTALVPLPPRLVSPSPLALAGVPLHPSRYVISKQHRVEL